MLPGACSPFPWPASHTLQAAGEPEDKGGNGRERVGSLGLPGKGRASWQSGRFPAGLHRALGAVRATVGELRGAGPLALAPALETRLFLTASSRIPSILWSLFLPVSLPPSCHSIKKTPRITVDQGSLRPQGAPGSHRQTAMTAGCKVAMERGPRMRTGCLPLSLGDPGKLGPT